MKQKYVLLVRSKFINTAFSLYHRTLLIRSFQRTCLFTLN